MKYDPKKKLFYYDIHSEEYKQTDHPALHTTLYQYDDDLKDFEIVVMNEEEKVNYLYGEALAAIKKYAEKKEEDKVDNDNVNHPKHYEGSCSIECINAMIFALGPDGTINFCAGNVFKYLWRYKNKNGEEDIDKAFWYLETARRIRNLYTVTHDTMDLVFRLQTFYEEVMMKNEENK